MDLELLKFVQTSNKLIAGVDPNTTDETLLGYLGAAYGYRAFIYLDMARMFEFWRMTRFRLLIRMVMMYCI